MKNYIDYTAYPTARAELLAACKHVLAILEAPKPNKPGGVSRAKLRAAIERAEKNQD